MIIWVVDVGNREKLSRNTYISVDLLVGLGRAAAEIAEFPLVVGAEKHVLRLDIPVRNGRLLGVHVRQALDNVRGYRDHLGLGQALGALISSILDQVE